MVQLAADSVVLLLRPDLLRAHALECFLRGLDRAGEHEADRLEEGHVARLDLTVLDPHRGLADVSGDQVDPLHLWNRHPERLCDRRFNEANAETDPHLARDDFDDEPRRLGVEAPQQLFERDGFLCRAPSRPDLLERRLDLLQRDVLVLGATLESLAGPVAQV